MEFKPRKGSKTAAVIDHLKANEEIVWFTRNAIAEMFGWEPKTIPTAMKPAVEAGALVRDDVDGACAFALPERVNQQAEQGEEQPFTAALDSEGELFLRGVQITGDGDALLTKAMTLQLREYLRHAGSWLDQLVSPAAVAAKAD